MTSRKYCPACQKQLSTTAFNDSAKSPDGLARTCRACTNARRRERGGSRDERPEPAGAAAKIFAALRQGDIQTMQKVLRAGVKPHWGWVCETMRGGHLALADLLLESGAERNVFTMAAMGEILRLKRRISRVPADAQLVASFEPACIEVTPLHVACASDWSPHGTDRMSTQVKVAAALVEHGADPSAVARYRGFDESTPLFCACWTSRNLSLAQWLLDRGAIATDRHLLAALGHVQRHGKEAYDIAEALLNWGLPVDGSRTDTRTPLQAFAHQGIHKTVSWLIAHGADVNVRGPGGRTAAHFAAERNTGPKTLAVLVEHGADLSLRDDDGRSPLDIAKLNGESRLVEWIESRMRSRVR